MNFSNSSEKYEKLNDPINIPTAAKGINNFKVPKSNSFLYLYVAIKSENIKIGSIIPRAAVKGIEIVIKGIEISAIDPPTPDLAIPNKIIAGTAVKKNKRFISIALMNLVILILED